MLWLLSTVPIRAHRREVPRGDLPRLRGRRGARESSGAFPESASAALPDTLGNPWQGPLVSRIDLRAGTDRGGDLGQFVVTASRTEFVLYRSDDGAEFERVGVLGTVDGVGLDHFCTNAASPCRRSRPDGFTQGDYTALSVEGEQLAAAFVLPRVLLPKADSGAVHVTVMAEPAPARARR